VGRLRPSGQGSHLACTPAGARCETRTTSESGLRWAIETPLWPWRSTATTDVRRSATAAPACGRAHPEDGMQGLQGQARDRDDGRHRGRPTHGPAGAAQQQSPAAAERSQMIARVSMSPSDMASMSTESVDSDAAGYPVRARYKLVMSSSSWGRPAATFTAMRSSNPANQKDPAPGTSRCTAAALGAA
jgi:hypothetical protein